MSNLYKAYYKNTYGGIAEIISYKIWESIDSIKQYVEQNKKQYAECSIIIQKLNIVDQYDVSSTNNEELNEDRFIDMGDGSLYNGILD